MNIVALKSMALTALSVLLLLTLAQIVFDAIAFHERDESFKTPWYSSSWLKSPYTNTRLALHKSSEHWTTNAVGSERWLVREVVVGDVIYWTTLERIPVAA